MKKLLILLTFLGLGVVSCTKENSSDTPEALTLTSDVATHYEGESFKFTVKSNDGSDVSSDSKILVDNVEIPGKTFYSLTAGTFKVSATHAGITTKAIEITVTKNTVPLTAITVTPSITS